MSSSRVWLGSPVAPVLGGSETGLESGLFNETDCKNQVHSNAATQRAVRDAVKRQFQHGGRVEFEA